MSQNKPTLWPHKCPVQGYISVETGHPCPWCAATEPRPQAKGYRAGDKHPTQHAAA